jgi:hypothetical protein
MEKNTKEAQPRFLSPPRKGTLEGKATHTTHMHAPEASGEGVSDPAFTFLSF